MTEYLNYKDIVILCSASKQFNTICKENNVVKIIKYRGFPRSKGHCNYINTLIICNELFGDDHDYQHPNNDISLILCKLYEKGYDLVRGDKINLCYNYSYDDDSQDEILFMFDGISIVSYSLHYEYLPDGLGIINDGVPLDYWEDSNHTNDIINFYHSKVSDQCFNNVVKTDISLYTTFTTNYNDTCKTYKITAYDGECNYIISIDDFKLILSNDVKLSLHINERYKNEIPKELNLYLDIDQYEEFYYHK